MLLELMVTIGKAREVRRARKLGRKQFEALKVDKFRRLVRHVRERSPYYPAGSSRSGTSTSIAASRATFRC